MGFNTTVVVMNDALSNIEKDPDFGKKLASAVREVMLGKPVDVSAGNFVNAATVIESHHSSGVFPVLVGGNHGWRLDISTIWTPDGDDREKELMTRLAHKHGYTLRKKAKR